MEEHREDDRRLPDPNPEGEYDKLSNPQLPPQDDPLWAWLRGWFERVR